MIVETAKEALKKLRRTNYKQRPDFGTDDVTELLISIISNECKSTVLSFNGEFKRYDSEIIRQNIDPIVRQLILNGTHIPKEVMNQIIYSGGEVLGVNQDIELYKGIKEDENGELQRVAAVSNPIINLEEISNNELYSYIFEEIYRDYGRQLLLNNLDKFPKQNSFTVFREKLLHGRDNKQTLTNKFIKLLKENTKFSDEIIKNTVEYYLDYLYNGRLVSEVINTINNGQGLVPIEYKKNKKGFDSLINGISIEAQDIMNGIPDINKISSDISQIYADVEAQLIAYSTDITKLSPDEIENTIKQINKASLQDEERKKYVGKNGYRTVNVGIGQADILLHKEYVEDAMHVLVKDIFELVHNSQKMSNEEYLKNAAALQYRFIRIHPFPDSNGRTSRALLNMMTIPKGILVDFPKITKKDFGRTTLETNMVLDEKNYLNAIAENSDDLLKMEQETSMPVYNYICKHAVVINPQRDVSNNNDIGITKDYDQELNR